MLISYLGNNSIFEFRTIDSKSLRELRMSLKDYNEVFII